MRTKTIRLYKLDELSEDAKQKAYEIWCQQEQGYFWQQENEESLKAFCNHFNIEVKNYDYSGNNHINFRFKNNDIENLQYVRLWKYIKSNGLEVVPSSEAWDKKTTTIYDDCPFTGYSSDEDLLEPIRNFLKKPIKKINFHDLIEDCLNNWIDCCYADYTYQISFECFVENSEANEWEFLENGEMA